MALLLDSHYHLDFLEDDQLQEYFLQGLAEKNIKIVAQTVTPSSFLALDQHYQIRKPSMDSKVFPNISLGFHPWYISSIEATEKDLAIFESAIARTHLIGEIGLDYTPRRLEHADRQLQLDVFREIIQKVVNQASDQPDQPPYVLSIHAVKSATEVLDVLEEFNLYQHRIYPILHRFNGTSDELTRHIRNGGFFSIHPQMLASKKGRAYVQQMPVDRILLESDFPEQKFLPIAGESPNDLSNKLVIQLQKSLLETLREISALRGEDILPILRLTQANLYQLPSADETI